MAIHYFGVAKQWVDQGKNSEAIEYNRKAIDISPNYVEAYVNLGILLGAYDRNSESINCMVKVAQIEPKDSKAYSK